MQRPRTLKRRDAPSSVAADEAPDVARLTRERDEAIEQLAATAEVLGVISKSPGELKPVFEAMLASAVRICGAKFGNLWLSEGNAFRVNAMHGAPPAYADFLRRNSVIHNVTPGTALGRIAGAKGRQSKFPTPKMRRHTLKVPLFTPARSSLRAPGPLSPFRCSRMRRWSERSLSFDKRCSRSPKGKSSY